MVAGLNVWVRIWRLTEQDDDAHGGANVTGSVVYDNVQSRFEEEEDELLLIQQPGMETRRMAKAIIVPGTLAIRESDEYQIVKPTNHPYYGDKFRIMRVKYPNTIPNNPNGYLRLMLTRSERAHRVQ